MHPLISPKQLESQFDSVVTCDIRWDLTDPKKGRATYKAGHLPGAVFVDLDTDLAGPPGIGGRHPLPDHRRFSETLGRLGISSNSHVVVYDDVAGRIAARMWWMLRAIGHENVQLLDGGLTAWEGEIETGWVEPTATVYPDTAGFGGVAKYDQLDGRTVVDARDGARYRGEHEPVDPKAGHIPGAINITTSRNLDESGRFLDTSSLADVYAGLGSDVVVSCGSGVTACHDALAMVVAGLEMPNVYVGSFSEWSRRDLPVEVGED